MRECRKRNASIEKKKLGNIKKEMKVYKESNGGLDKKSSDKKEVTS